MRLPDLSKLKGLIKSGLKEGGKAAKDVYEKIDEAILRFFTGMISNDQYDKMKEEDKIEAAMELAKRIEIIEHFIDDKIKKLEEAHPDSTELEELKKRKDGIKDIMKSYISDPGKPLDWDPFNNLQNFYRTLETWISVKGYYEEIKDKLEANPKAGRLFNSMSGIAGKAWEKIKGVPGGIWKGLKAIGGGVKEGGAMVLCAGLLWGTALAFVFPVWLIEWMKKHMPEIKFFG